MVRRRCPVTIPCLPPKEKLLQTDFLLTFPFSFAMIRYCPVNGRVVSTRNNSNSRPLDFGLAFLLQSLSRTPVLTSYTQFTT